MDRKKRSIRRFRWPLAILLALSLLWLLFKLSTRMPAPADELQYELGLERSMPAVDVYVCGDSWLKKNEHGLWEMYLAGSDVELGVKNGILAREQIRYQEEVFISRLREMVPGEGYIRFLKQMIIWMNRRLDDYIPEEYQREIYGVSLYASDSFDFIGPPYSRILNYHAAHDIGHALQNMNLVACTALGVKGERSESGALIVGRNFDFHMGDDFARNKILAFYEPDQGHAFASITWGGMIGVVSGMNEQGLVVTLNAAKSGIPSASKTPVSILARKILQYAGSIQEAWDIAAEYETFVSESFLISSAAEKRTVVIEKSPGEMGLYDPGEEDMILTNHFQSKVFKDTERTQQNILEGASMYRWERSRELLEQRDRHSVESMAGILRDRHGKRDHPIGTGNERAINQMVAHHSVIFEPESLRLWISMYPYQLGTYLCYDLERVFSGKLSALDTIRLAQSLPEDPFLHSQEYLDFKEYQRISREIRTWLDEGGRKEDDHFQVEAFLQLNPDYYHAWYLAGEVHAARGEHELARQMYAHSLSLEIPRLVDREQVEEALEENLE